MRMQYKQDFSIFLDKRGGFSSKKIKMIEHVDSLNELIKNTQFLNAFNPSLKMRFKYAISNRLEIAKCKNCNKDFLDLRKAFCSIKCSNNFIETKNKMKETWKNKDKTEVEKIQQKRKNTNLKIYGVDIASKLSSTIEIMKKTNLEKYGVEYAIQNDDVKLKRRLTCIEKWGGVGWESDILYNKMKQSNFEKYGVEYYSTTDEWYDKCVQTCMQKYGEKWISNVDEINAQQQCGGYSRKYFSMPSGKMVNVQGYEDKALIILLEKYEEPDIVMGISEIIKHTGIIHYNFLDKRHRYYPDIFIKSENMIIEVKSSYTFNFEIEKNILKRAACIDLGLKFKFMIL